MTALRPVLQTLLLCGLFSMLGCEPLISHDSLTQVFNGVPTLPPKEEYCRDHFAKLQNKQEKAATVAEEPTRKSEGSKHAPYAEKHCDNCHASEGGVSNALLKPKNELCFLCHKNLLNAAFLHGPASDGECLACHEPHESSNESLLSKPRSKICGKCHEEKRLASAMHERLTEGGVACPDCHDPHAGASKYFIK